MIDTPGRQGRGEWSPIAAGCRGPAPRRSRHRPIGVDSNDPRPRMERRRPGIGRNGGGPSDALPLLTTTNLAPQTPTPRPPEQGLLGGDNLDEVMEVRSRAMTGPAESRQPRLPPQQHGRGAGPCDARAPDTRHPVSRVGRAPPTGVRGLRRQLPDPHHRFRRERSPGIASHPDRTPPAASGSRTNTGPWTPRTSPRCWPTTGRSSAYHSTPPPPTTPRSPAPSPASPGTLPTHRTPP